MRHNEVSEEESEYGLHIRHVHPAHHAGHGDESDSRNGGTYHSERDDIPRRFVLSFEERCIRTAFASGDTGYQ